MDPSRGWGNTVRSKKVEAGKEVGGSDGDGVEGEASPEVHPAGKVVVPGKPGMAEVWQREIAHLLLRNWRGAYAQGRGANRLHRGRRDEQSLQDIHFDAMLLGDRGGPGGTLVCIMAREVFRIMLVMTLPSHTGGDESSARVHVADRMLAWGDASGLDRRWSSNTASTRLAGGGRPPAAGNGSPRRARACRTA